MLYHFLVLTPALLLLYLVRFQIFGLPTNLLEIYIGVLFVWWIIDNRKSFASVFTLNGIQKKILFTAAGFASAAFIALLATLWRIPPEYWTVPLGIFKGWVVVPILFCLMCATTIRSEQQWKQLILISIYGGGIYAGLALLDYFTGILPLPGATYDSRLVWPFFDPATFEAQSANYPALLIGPLLTLAIVAVASKTSRHPAVIISIILLAAALYFTRSFAAWIAVGASLTLVFFIQASSRRKLHILVLAMVLASALIATQWNSEKFQWALKTDADSSTAERIRIYTVAGEMIAQNPLMGVGIGQFQTTFEEMAPEVLQRPVTDKEIHHAVHAHNLYLMMHLSFGILGLVTFLILIMMLLRYHPPHTWLIAITPLLTILIHSVFDTPYFKYDLAVEFWLIVAIITISKALPLQLAVSQISGRGVATKLGFPTLNLRLPDNAALPHGVYAAAVIIGGKRYAGVLGYGRRLTQGIDEVTCEIHLFEPPTSFPDTMVLEVGGTIRRWKKFKDISELAKAVKKDILTASSCA